MKKKKYLTKKQAWELVKELAEKLGNIQAVSKQIGCSHTTLYRYGSKEDWPPDVRITMELKELAIKQGIRKS